MSYSKKFTGGVKLKPGIKRYPFWFVRHGATLANGSVGKLEDDAKLFEAQGASSNGVRNLLTEFGKKQGFSCGLALPDDEITTAICSTQPRALQTAFYAKAFDKWKVLLLKNIKERDFKLLEGTMLPTKAFQGPWPGTQDPTLLSKLVVELVLEFYTQIEGVVWFSHGGILGLIGGVLGVVLCPEHRKNGYTIRFDPPADPNDGEWTYTVLAPPIKPGDIDIATLNKECSSSTWQSLLEKLEIPLNAIPEEMFKLLEQLSVD